MLDTRDSHEKLLSRPASPASQDPCEERHYGPRERSNTLVAGILACLFISFTTNLVLAWGWHTTAGSLALKEHPRQLPYPGREAIEYTQVVFASSVSGGMTPYQGYPTEESERLWEALYHPLFSRISYDEARVMPNKTAGEGNLPGQGYITSMNVFHDLHCLHGLRTFAYYFLGRSWNGTSNPYTQNMSIGEVLERLGHNLKPDHIDHCIDVLRQSLMCTADITPNVFQYSARAGEVRPRSTVLHECRDFDKIKQWAVEHDVGEFADWGAGPEVGKCAIDVPEECEL